MEATQPDGLSLLFIVSIRRGGGLLLLGRSNASIVARSVWHQLPCQLLPSRLVSSSGEEVLPSLALRRWWPSSVASQQSVL